MYNKYEYNLASALCVCSCTFTKDCLCSARSDRLLACVAPGVHSLLRICRERLRTMPTGARQRALRAFGVVVRRMARKYRLAQADITANSVAKDVVRVYRRLCKKVHPDKGGSTADFQDLDGVYQAWSRLAEQDRRPPGDEARAPSAPQGTWDEGDAAPEGDPARTCAGGAAAPDEHPQSVPVILPERDVSLQARRPCMASVPPAFRIQSAAVLLTYSLGEAVVSVWGRFVQHVRRKRKEWKVQHWCATMEACEESGNLHLHLMLQFVNQVDMRSTCFSFEGVRPNARPSWSDYLGEKFSTRSAQMSIDRGFFYVWADKIGTQRTAEGAICVDGDYAPVWTSSRKRYRVQRKWAQSLWEARKLTHDVYDDLIFATRQSVVGAKRNLNAVRERELEREEEEEMREVVKRIRSNAEIYRPFLRVPEADKWLQYFDKDALRFPILLALGPSGVGKTEWVKSLFRKPLELKVGALVHFPDKMRLFNRREYDGVVLDDVRDLDFLAQHQHILQGKYDERVEFASTPGGQCAFRRWLYRVPFAATVNYSTANLGYLKTHDWLNKPDNCVLVELETSPVEPAPGPSALPAQPSVLAPADAFKAWSVSDVKAFLCSQDLHGLAEVCFANGVNGVDFDSFHEQTLETDLRLTPFQGRKLLAARATFLAGEAGDGRTGR